MKSAHSVLVERRGAIAIVTLNRPERRNGVTVAMCVALHAALVELSTSDARVLILRGAGEDFSVGADLGGEEAQGDSSPEALGPVYHAATLLHTMPQITIAAIDGGCAGAAMGWACACDFRFATSQARFATAFLKVAVSGDMGLAWSLTRLVGSARARELMLFPEKLSGTDALALGLVTRLFAREELHTATLALAEELAARDPYALRLHKANLLSAEQLDIAAYIEIESARHMHSTSRPELRARMAEVRNRLGDAKGPGTR